MNKQIRRFFALPAMAVMLSAGPGLEALAQTAPAGQQYVVVYGELAPNYVAERDGKQLLEYLARLASQSPGVQYFAVNSEIGRPNFFTLTEVWQNAASYSGFTSAASTQQALGYLRPLLLAPLDERDGNLVSP